MRTLGAAWRGIARALSSPKLLLWLWAINLLAAIPAALVIEEALLREVGASRVEESLRHGFDMTWFGEFQHRARGVEKSFTPTHSGPGAFFANLDRWLRGDLLEEPPPLVAFGLVYALVWVLLLGGILDRWLRPAASLELPHFLAASGRYFFRLARLALLAAGLYYGVYRFARALFPWLEERFDSIPRETPILLAYLAGAAGIALLLITVRMASDYAKVALVSERRRSALIALLGGLRLVVAHPVRTFGLALLFGGGAAVALALYSLVAPGATASNGWALAAGLVIAQLYLVLKLVGRLSFLGAEVAVFQDVQRDELPPPL